jgi:hypothetical protein
MGTFLRWVLGRNVHNPRVDAQGVVSETTQEEKGSVPVLAIFTAEAAGGWFLIPLKFAWVSLLGIPTRNVRSSRKKRKTDVK